MADSLFHITLQNFNEGNGPVVHLDDKSFIGNGGHAGDTKCDLLSKPGFVTQSPGLVTLSNGDESGVVTELVRFILDIPTDIDTTFGLADTKLLKISSTTVKNSDGWPRAVATMLQGESLIRLKNNLYGFYNRTIDGDIFRLPVSASLQQRSPSTAVNDNSYGTDAWTPDGASLSSDIAVLDSSFCNFEPASLAPSQYLKATNFGFSIPVTATIKGITVYFKKKVDVGLGGNVLDDKVLIVKAGTPISIQNKALGVWPLDGYVGYGGELDLWGTTWTPADINDSAFGVALSAKVSQVNPVAKIDHCLIVVNYTNSTEVEGDIINEWGSFIDKPLQNAPHPAAVKEDILIFGNGRYAGVFIEGNSILDTQKLDFGEGSQVADVVFNANVWWIAVNRGVGGRVQGEIYLYDGSALSSVLADEAGVGLQKIGFLYVLNGSVYVCYEELSSNSFIVGVIAGRQIKPLTYFSGTLPDHKQKTLFKNTILFISNNEVWTFGAVVQSLPLQISRLSSGGYSTLGAIASPFGVPMIASTQASSYKLAQFSGYSTDSHHKSLYIDVTNQRDLGKITEVIVTTKSLIGTAQATVTIEGNQSSTFSSPLAINITSKNNVPGFNNTRFVFRSINLNHLADIRVVIDYSVGDTVNDCPIRKIEIGGVHVKE